MSEKGSIRGLTESTLTELRNMVDSNTVIGDPIKGMDGTIILPVTRLTVTFASGGMDFGDGGKKELGGENPLGGGSGGNVTMSPVAFLVVSPKDGVSLLQVADRNQSLDRALNLLPGILRQMSSLLQKKTGVTSAEEEEEPFDPAEGNFVVDAEVDPYE